jgi:protein ImuB
MADRDEQIARLPQHQRPPPRELGRRSEPADHPFKAMRPDEVGGRGRGAPAPLRPIAQPTPLVTAISERQKMVIAAADAGALALGLAPGMALTHARALQPDLDVRDAEPAADLALLTRLGLFAVRRWTPTAMVDGTNGLLMDLTGVTHLHGGERRMGRRIIAFCARLGLDARFAIAGSIGAAHALARYGRERVTLCAPYGEPEALCDLPVAALRLEPHQQDAARRLGIDRIGDLIAMPRAPLAKRFGASLLDRLDQATGRVAEPFDALLPFVVPEEELRFAEPIGGADGIARAMAELVAALADHLRGRGLGVRVVRLVCDRVDRQDQIITVGMARATREVAHILRLLAMKIETIDPGFGIDAMRLIAVRTEPLGASVVEGDLGGQPANADMALLIDQIITRLGTHSIYRASAIESDVPERSVGRIAAMADPTGWPDPWPRPVRLLASSRARSDHVMALLPDHPPRRFTWRGRGL